MVQTQPHLQSGALQAADTTTAARMEAQQATPEAAQQVRATAEHTKGVAEHAASTAHVRFPFSRFSTFFFVVDESHHPLNGYQTRGSGVTGNVSDAVTQLRAKVEATTDAAVTEGQKSVQAAADAGANYLGQAKNLASSAIYTAVVCLWHLRGAVEHVLTFVCSHTFLRASQEEQLGTLPSLHRVVPRAMNLLAMFPRAAQSWKVDNTQ